MRCYLFVLGTWHLTTEYFISTNDEVAISLTCFIPAMLNELALDNFVNHFSVRTFSLFVVVAIASSFQPHWPPTLPIAFPAIENVFLLNAVQLLLILFLFLLAICNDRLRGATRISQKAQNELEAKARREDAAAQDEEADEQQLLQAQDEP